jgi:hypothetical protein
MRTLISCVVVAVLGAAGVASAQPGADPGAPPPYSPPPPAPCCNEQPVHVPPPYQYQQPVVLTLDEQRLLDEGEIPIGRYLGGGITSIFVGFGIGHAVQGRWSETGWIFTLGQAASLTALIYGISQSDCFLFAYSCNDRGDDDGVGFIVGGVIGLVGFRIWELVDVWVGPPRHNRRVRALRMRLGLPPVTVGKRMTPYLVPPSGGSGAVAGVSLSF